MGAFFCLVAAFFGRKIRRLRGRFLRPAGRSLFLLPQRENVVFRPPGGFANRTENGELGTMGLSDSNCFFELAQSLDLLF